MIRAALLACLMASPAIACDEYVFHVGSYHTDTDLIGSEVENESNLGFGCRIAGYEFGAYKNSYSDDSVYAVRDWGFDNGLGVFAGLASGYHNDAAAPSHGVIPIGGIAYRGQHMTLRASPTYAEDTGDIGAVLSLSLTFGGQQ
ncbi:MAG: hypothetical protein AAFR73_12360 [Pseudomonadota bacterium]